MSEYSDATSINKIIGSAPGYVGYQDNNTITSKLKENPTAIILLDEIDKAHPTITNLLYQILDESTITDAQNNTINLNNNIIIMTSNIGFEEKTLGFTNTQNPLITSKLKEKFPPSLINRIDTTVIFNRLTKDDITKIINNKLQKLTQKYPDFTYTKSLVQDIINKSNYQEFGARKLDKIIEYKLENIIIDKIINHDSLNINSLTECLSV